MNFVIYVVLLGILHLSQQDCSDNGQHFIPFIASIITDKGECQGVLISRDYVLANGKCVSGSNAAIIRLGIKNNPYTSEGQVFASEKVTLHPNFRKVSSTHYLNDIALIKLTSPVNLTQTVSPAKFLLEEPNVQTFLGKNASLVVWKAGYLHTVSGIILENSKCMLTFGEDFDINQHLCIEISDDIFIIHVQDSIGHPVVVENNVIGFAIHYPILNKNGKMYRIKKVFPTLKWVEQFTSINRDSNLTDSLFLDNCRLQNKVNDMPQEKSVKIEEEILDRLKNMIDQLIKEEVKSVKNESLSQLSSIKQTIGENGKVLVELETEAENRFLSIETVLNNKSQEIMFYIKEKLSFIQTDIQDKSKNIMSNIESKYSDFQSTLAQREEKLKSSVALQISKLEKVIRENDSQLKAMAKRLSDIENQMKIQSID